MEQQKIDSRERPENGGATPRSLEAVMHKNVEIIRQLEAAADAQRTPADRTADVVSQFAGSMKFVLLHVAWFGLWIAFNSLPMVPSVWRIDPFPFTFPTFMVSLEAIFLSTFILISQNHEERLAQRRAHLDLQINLLSEQESSLMLRMLESIEQKLKIQPQPDARALEEATKPEAIVEEIQNYIEKKR
jgi:uncharacterized membrane protein